MLKSNGKQFVINDYIENDPLSENNLDTTLNLVNEIRLSLPQKSIWLYTGYEVIGISKGFWGLEPNVISEKILDSKVSTTSPAGGLN